MPSRLAKAATKALQWVCLPGMRSGRPSGRPVSQSMCSPAIHLLSTPIESSACASFSPFGETMVTSAAKPRAGAATRAAAKTSVRMKATMASLPGEMKARPY